MRTLFLASAAAAAVLAGFAGGSAWAQQGGYRGGGQSGPSQGAQSNFAALPSGSYQRSCRNMQGGNGTLTAECADTQGRFRISTLQYSGCHGEVGNNNGLLVCAGATATPGAYVDNGGGGNKDRRDNNGGAAAGFIAGLAAGQGGNAQVYTPGYSYPTYGDQHYGDPRFDPRYGPQGWGAGHRPGEWVWIRDRAPWLSRQIDRETQDGSLRRRQADDLRQQLSDLEDRENQYRRQGLSNWMKADLDKRFDQLAALVYDARRDRGPPPPPRHDDHGGYGYDGGR